MFQQLRALVPPAEDPGSIPRTHVAVYNHLNYSSRESSTLCWHWAHKDCTDVHAQTPIYIQKPVN